MRRLLREERRAVLATIDGNGRPRLVPICFALDERDEAQPVLWTPIDEKPKASPDPLALARVRDIRARPQVQVLADRWDEDWSRLAWLRISGVAEVVGEAPQVVLDALRARYPQYGGQRLEGRPIIRIAIERVKAWGAFA
jgi:PPOX class probable F420-dependent enzyme